ncbi:MAG TPA: hypothetical protein VLE73_02630 [Candidatus Saccharimonadales bacterium]|nr:hypothetical protein [Candidatus Saccharimonadales bacterium]
MAEYELTTLGIEVRTADVPQVVAALSQLGLARLGVTYPTAYPRGERVVETTRPVPAGLNPERVTMVGELDSFAVITEHDLRKFQAERYPGTKGLARRLMTAMSTYSEHEDSPLRQYTHRDERTGELVGIHALSAADLLLRLRDGLSYGTGKNIRQLGDLTVRMFDDFCEDLYI